MRWELLYRCLTGRLPWDSETTTQMVTAHVLVAPAPLPDIPDLPADMRALCMECLAKDPKDRPDAAAVAARLAAAAGIVPRHSMVPAEPIGFALFTDETTLIRGRGPNDRRRILLGLAALVAIAALVTGVILHDSGADAVSTADPARPAPSAPATPLTPAPSESPVAAPATSEPPAAPATSAPPATPAAGDRTAVHPARIDVPTEGGTVVALCIGGKVSVISVLPQPACRSPGPTSAYTPRRRGNGHAEGNGHHGLEYGGWVVPKKMNRLGALAPTVRGFFFPIEKPAPAAKPAPRQVESDRDDRDREEITTGR
ncbi:hypothetical protein GCM10020218_079900 [Dactylosporangium vinaceum]